MLRFFGRLRDLGPGDARELDLPPEIASTDALRKWLGRDHPLLLDPSVRIALDDRLTVTNEPLGDAREVAFLPPVSGG